MTPILLALTRVSDVLGWALIHFLWQGTLLALALAMARLVLPRRMARTRYVAGCATLAVMLAAPVATTFRLIDPAQPVSPFFDRMSDATASTAPVEAAVLPARTEVSPVASPRAITPRTRSGAVASVDPGQLLPWLVLCWSIGVLACSLRLAGGLWQARRLTRIGTRPMSTRWETVTRELAARLRLSRPVRILESARVQVPIVVGWLRPVLLVPAAVMAALPAAQLEAIIAHELAHIRRHDYLVNVLQTAVETLLFYHPAVWWVSHTVRVEREHCCDDLAVIACGDAVLYARALTEIEMLRQGDVGVALAINGSPLLARVRRLLGVKPPARVSSSGWVVAILTTMMVSGAGLTNWMRGLPVAFGQASPMAEPQSPKTATPAPARTPDPAPPTTADDDGVDEPGGADPAGMAEADRAIREAEESMARAMAEQTRALRTSSAAMARAQAETHAQQSEGIRQARQLAREAMRQAHEMMRTAHAAVRDAQRAMNQARRAAVGARWNWQSWDVDMPPVPPAPPDVADIPDLPEIPDAPEWPIEAPPPAPPTPAAPPALPRGGVVTVPPAPPAPAAVPAPPVRPAFPAPSAPAAVPPPPAPAATPAPPAPPAPPAARSWNSSDRSGSWNMVHSDNGDTLRISGRGKVTFSDDETDVTSVSPGGSFTLERTVGGDTHRFDVNPSAAGLDRRYRLNGRELDAATGRQWVASQLPGVLRRMAVNVDRRVAKWLAQGGPDHVLAEVARLDTSFSKSAHLRELYSQARLDDGTLTRSFQQAGREIESDFELAQALKTAADRQPIDRALPAFIAASRTIESDFEQHHVLARALARPGLAAGTAAQLFTAATPGPGGAGIDSDFELASLLMGIPPALVDASGAAWLDAVRSIESDFERRRALVAAARGPLGDGTLTQMVGVAAQMDSEFERGQAFIALSRIGLGPSARKALVDAANAMQSDFERGRVLTALGRSGASR